MPGVQAELILGAIERKARSAQPSNSSYLEQRVQYMKEGAQLVDEESQGVMMAWEGPLMQAHAKVYAISYNQRNIVLVPQINTYVLLSHSLLMG
jgi:protein arginine N-methyltransferase 2